MVHILHCIVFKLLKTKKLKKCIMNSVLVGTHCNSVAFRGAHSGKTRHMCVTGHRNIGVLGRIILTINFKLMLCKIYQFHAWSYAY